MPNIDPRLRDTLTLVRIRGLGPVRVRALLEVFGSASAVLNASVASLEAVEGIGRKTAEAVGRDRSRAAKEAERELDRAEAIGAQLITADEAGYPPLLRDLPDRPVVLSVLGSLEPEGLDRFGVGIVGSRRCSAYGIEQAERFGGALARAGLSVVSGGARGIDTAAHRGALLAQGRTIAVLGCGLAHVYPPENRAMFDRIVENGGAIVSELPIDAPPAPEHFPVRNRLISGMSLGVLVVEAGLRSGALITARQAVEEHGREVFALPGRVDSESCAGSLDLLKRGGAALVTEPGDVVQALESAARHLVRGTHTDRYLPTAPAQSDAEPLGEVTGKLGARRPNPASAGPEARLIQEACVEPLTVDGLIRATGLDPAGLSRQLTMLELSGLIARQGAYFIRR